MDPNRSRPLAPANEPVVHLLANAKVAPPAPTDKPVVPPLPVDAHAAPPAPEDESDTPPVLVADELGFIFLVSKTSKFG